MATFSGFPKATAQFLRELSRNNDKAWFDAHRENYDDAYVRPALELISVLGPRLRAISPAVSFDPKVNGSLFRIQRDVRFSKDKTPYKAHIDLWFWHGDRRGWDAPGFFFRLSADGLILGAGMHRFEKPQLDLYRQAVVAARAGHALEKALAEVRAAGPYAIGGASRKSVPKGFPADHERAGLLLHEGLWAELHTEVEQIAESPDFVDFCFKHYAAMWPVAQWLLGNVAAKGTRA